jgi:TolA-binding protein
MTREILRVSVWVRACGIAAALVGMATAASAQTTVTATDIQRLQDQVYQASSDISRMHSTNSSMAADLQSQLDDLRDEVVYLKVKLRREGSVSNRDYADVRDRLQDLRTRARGDSTTTARQGSSTWGTGSGTSGGVSGGTSGGTSTGTSGGVTGGVMGDERVPSGSSRQGSTVIPVGQEIDVRLQSELSSGTAQVEQRFEATTVADLYRGNDVLIPAGSTVRGVVSSVDKATRTDRKGSMTVSFDQITIRGRNYPMRGTVTQAIESEGIKGEAGKIGAGAGVGAIIGGILGGVKGALLGVLIGGGGTIAATEGKDVTLPAGTILRVRLDTPPAVR